MHAEVNLDSSYILVAALCVLVITVYLPNLRLFPRDRRKVKTPSTLRYGLRAMRLSIFNIVGCYKCLHSFSITYHMVTIAYVRA